MKKTTAAHKKSKEVDTTAEMPEQQKTKGAKSGNPRFEREEERVHERIDENVQAELSGESLKKVTSVLRKMADTVVEFGEVMAEIGNSRTGGGIIKRTFENIAEMINGVSSSQPPQQEGLLDDDDIFNQPSFLDAVSALEQAFLQTRKNYAAQPEQPTTSQSQHHIQTPTFDLGVPSPQPAAMEQPQNKIDSAELRNIARDLDEDSEKTISDEQQLHTTPEDNTMKQSLIVGPKEKLISDYAFLDPTEERPLTEQLFEYAGYYLDRETFQTMRAGELESVIVDVWCLRLNQLDLNRGLDKPKRIFFSTQAFIQLDSPTNWEKGENAEQSSCQIDFEQCLDTEINNVGKLDISDAQLDPYLAFTTSIVHIEDSHDACECSQSNCHKESRRTLYWKKALTMTLNLNCNDKCTTRQCFILFRCEANVALDYVHYASF
nr:uncharacterized protein LOC109153584 [Ipomoea trifida]